jgi:hypothetical protein
MMYCLGGINNAIVLLSGCVYYGDFSLSLPPHTWSYGHQIGSIVVCILTFV